MTYCVLGTPAYQPTLPHRLDCGPKEARISVSTTPQSAPVGSLVSRLQSCLPAGCVAALVLDATGHKPDPASMLIAKTDLLIEPHQGVTLPVGCAYHVSPEGAV